MSAASLKVYVTHHAKEQAWRRHLDFWNTRGIGGIFAEVRQAIDEGRMAKSRPAWCSLDGKRRKGPTRRGVHRFVWNAELTRCYALAKGRNPSDEPAWIVTTVLSRAEDFGTRGTAPVPVTA